MTDAHCHVSCGDPSVREFLIGRDFAGVHPWEVVGNNRIIEYSNNRIAELRERLTAESQLGVGEIGLDRLKDRNVSPEMREMFETQLKLAIEFHRPVVLHGAKCWGQVVQTIQRVRVPSAECLVRSAECGVLSEECGVLSAECGVDATTAPDTTHQALSTTHQAPSTKHQARGTKHQALSTKHQALGTSYLFHGFSRSDGLIPDIVKLNGYISVGPAVLNDHAVNYRELVKKIPLDRLLVETDRTEANAAACPSVREVAMKTAELRGMSIEELEKITDENAARFIGRE